VYAGTRVCRVGQNRIYTPYMTVYLVLSLPKIPYINRIYMVLANSTYLLSSDRVSAIMQAYLALAKVCMHAHVLALINVCTQCCEGKPCISMCIFMHTSLPSTIVQPLLGGLNFSGGSVYACMHTNLLSSIVQPLLGRLIFQRWECV